MFGTNCVKMFDPSKCNPCFEVMNLVSNFKLFTVEKLKLVCYINLNRAIEFAQRYTQGIITMFLNHSHLQIYL